MCVSLPAPITTSSTCCRSCLAVTRRAVILVLSPASEEGKILFPNELQMHFRLQERALRAQAFLRFWAGGKFCVSTFHMTAPPLPLSFLRGGRELFLAAGLANDDKTTLVSSKGIREPFSPRLTQLADNPLGLVLLLHQNEGASIKGAHSIFICRRALNQATFLSRWVEQSERVPHIK